MRILFRELLRSAHRPLREPARVESESVPVRLLHLRLLVAEREHIGLLVGNQGVVRLLSRVHGVRLRERSPDLLPPQDVLV